MNLLHLSLPEWSPLHYFALLCLQVFSVSNFYPDTRGEGGHLFRLTRSAVLWGGKNTTKNSLACVGSTHSVWITVGLPLITACVLSQSTLVRLQIALQGKCLKWALGFIHFPGLSHSGSGSWVLHKGTDSVGPVFCALPRSEQLRRPGAWQVHSPQVGGVCLVTSLVPAAWFPGCAVGTPSQVCHVSPLGS